MTSVTDSFIHGSSHLVTSSKLCAMNLLRVIVCEVVAS